MLGLTAGKRMVFTQFDDGTTLRRAKRRSILDIERLLEPVRGRCTIAIKDMNIGRP